MSVGMDTAERWVQAEPVSTAEELLVTLEFDDWDDPGLAIAVNQVAEQINADFSTLMARLELYKQS